MQASIISPSTRACAARANLSWKIESAKLVYYTWSQGFRPDGFNIGLVGHPPVD